MYLASGRLPPLTTRGGVPFHPIRWNAGCLCSTPPKLKIARFAQRLAGLRIGRQQAGRQGSSADNARPPILPRSELHSTSDRMYCASAYLHHERQLRFVNRNFQARVFRQLENAKFQNMNLHSSRNVRVLPRTVKKENPLFRECYTCLLYTSPSPRD